jgi:hypothetical protein
VLQQIVAQRGWAGWFFRTPAKLLLAAAGLCVAAFLIMASNVGRR